MPSNYLQLFYPKRSFRLWLLCAIFCFALLLTWWILPWFIEDPMPTIMQQTPVRQYRDSTENLIFMERTWDYQWRLPVPLEQISPDFLAAVIAIEDHDFYSHHGVSYASLARALCFNLLRRGHRSGASTLTMQLASLPREGRKKSYLDKLIQILQARKLERLYSKERILLEYVNRIPFGRKIYGIEAAAWHYFDKPAKELLPHEAMLLAGLPQKPNGYNPQYHPQTAKERQQMVFSQMQREGLISQQEAQNLKQQPLHYRDFDTTSFMEAKYDSSFFHYIQQARKELADSSPAHVELCLNQEYQNLLLNVLRQTVETTPNVNDGAAVLLDSKTSSVLAMVGTLDFHNKINGQVNVAIRPRSAGSTLKPFIYAEALDGGLITALSLLQDTPMVVGNYVPQNFDGTFRGPVTAADALVTSLNIPAIRLLKSLQIPRVKGRLASLGLSGSTQYSVDKYGLTLALGTEGYALLNLTNAYACLANQGTFTPYHFTKAKYPTPQQIYTPGTADMISWILRQRPLPNCLETPAWKTGTSNGLCDAWCIAYTPQFTLGIWFGNKNGKPAAALVGGQIAAPAAGRILSVLHEHSPIQWAQLEENLEYKAICSQSGLLPTNKCTTTYGWANRAFTIPRCTQCQNPVKPTLKILSPKRRLYLCPDSYGVKLILQSNCNNAEWYIDNQFMGTIPPGKEIRFAPGYHTLHAVTTSQGDSHASFSFHVQQMP